MPSPRSGEPLRPPAPAEERPAAKDRRASPSVGEGLNPASAVSGETPPPHPAPEPDVDGSGDAESQDAGAERYIWSADPQGIQGAVRHALPAVEECYSAWVKSHPELRGKLVVSFEIAQSSAEVARERGVEEPIAVVGDLAIEGSELKHVPLEGCVLNVLSDLVFEVPESGATRVRFPFQFDVD